MAANTPTEDVALLLDWENLKESLHRHFSTKPNIEAILAKSRAFGRLVLARAYADWTDYQRLGIDAPRLLRNAIDPVYATGGGLKNSADLRLAVDAIELCERLPQIATYVLGTGDGGLIHVVNYLKLRGRKVVILAVGASLSSSLAEAADLAILYERSIEPGIHEQKPVLEKAPVPVTVTPTVAAKQPAVTKAKSVPPSWPVITSWIATIITELGPAPVPFTAIASKLKDRHGITSKDYELTFLALMQRIASMQPMLITSTPMLNASSNTAIHYAQLPTTQGAAKIQQKAQVRAPLNHGAIVHQALLELPSAVVEARSKSQSKVAYPPVVQLLIQERIGHTFKEIGTKPGAFFAAAAERNLVQLVTVKIAGKQSPILLLPGEEYR